MKGTMSVCPSNTTTLRPITSTNFCLNNLWQNCKRQICFKRSKFLNIKVIVFHSLKLFRGCLLYKVRLWLLTLSHCWNELMEDCQQTLLSIYITHYVNHWTINHHEDRLLHLHSGQVTTAKPTLDDNLLIIWLNKTQPLAAWLTR